MDIVKGNMGWIEVVVGPMFSGKSEELIRRLRRAEIARQRAEMLQRIAQQTSKPWNYFVGLEGGLDSIVNGGEHRVFLESWAYVSDGARGHFGRSGSIELPGALAHEVLENGVELSIAIDRFAGAVGIRDAQGAWGVLSNNFITRQEAFRVAVIAAFAPFYNMKLYRAAAVGASESSR